ncbi:Xyloglucan endotransglucosylase/hydrolase [Rhynchospora pubera]|uniref:Xyloglucan endotransglucosylase/hydrolase n=1 Tax=Rhynchospora pubera TaxID=906938 RepID=A0AAV8EFB6_9POAL|nr:Xyloglucan endotransglucosylase/hydrolase [Rhynchospora pubera]
MGSFYMDCKMKVLISIMLLWFASSALAINTKTLAFREAYSKLFGHHNIHRSANDHHVRLLLDRSSGSGFISSDMYQYGLFSASIKLPSDYTAGVVVAFYTSNGDVFEKTHDELDFEFLGNIKGKEWRVQTNIYGNGSTSRGREERYFMPFDPTKEFHRYSILWTNETIIFYIDQTPIREVRRTEAMGGDYPSKPMSLYATIWDASNWATSGGKYKVNYKYGPFTSEFRDLSLVGCRVDPIQMLPTSSNNCTAANLDLMATGLSVMTPKKRKAMQTFRENFMSYSACYDTLRYPEKLPECEIVEAEKRLFKENGHLKFRRHRRQRSSRARIRTAVNRSLGQQWVM